MKNINSLAKKLSVFIELDSEKTREEIAGYIVAELIGDYDGLHKELVETNPKIRRIADLASDLEWSNGSDEECAAMWSELKDLIKNLA